MFRQFFIFALFATCFGYCLADGMPEDAQHFGPPAAVPVWPAPGSEADMQVGTSATHSGVAFAGDENDNIRIVSQIGADLVVENNINLGARGGNDMGFSGGPNLTHGYQAPMGFNIYEGQADMPLMHQEMMEDDGARVLAASRSGRKRPPVRNQVPASALRAGQSGIDCDEDCDDDIEIEDADMAGAGKVPDQVKSWVVASGQTLREVLQDWANKEGWDLVWSTSREYPIQASAVFKGRFLDVSSALVRNFSRANPVPYAKFYKGNRVLVISAAGGE